MYCEWLDLLSETLLEEMCTDDDIKLTCRSTCRFCTGLLLDFDDVELTESPYYSNYTSDIIFMDNLGVFHGDNFQALFHEFPGIAKAVNSGDNAGAIYYPDQPALFICPEGNFDMVSMFVNSITGNSTLLKIEAFDDLYEYVDEVDVSLILDDVSSVTFRSTFNNIRAVSISTDDGLPIGFDDIEIFINAPCFGETGDLSVEAMDFLDMFQPDDIPGGPPKTFLGFNYDGDAL